MGYATVPELKSALALRDDAIDAELASALDSASRLVDDYCRRHFTSAAETRYYSPRSQGVLFVDDLVSVTTLKADAGGDGTYEQTWTANTDYVLLPENADLRQEPYTEIQPHPSARFTFPTWYPRSVQIIGTFGWPAVPAPVKEATLLLAAQLLKRVRDAPFGVAQFADSGAVQLRTRDGHVDLLLTPYRRILMGRG